MVYPFLPAFVRGLGVDLRLISLALILTIVGTFIFNPSMQAYIGDRVPYQSRGLVPALIELGWSISFIVGVPLAGLLIARNGWQAPFPWISLFGGLTFGLLAWIIPKDSTSQMVALIPATAYREVKVGEKSYWAFTITVRIPTLGKVRIVISYENADLAGTYVTLVTNRVDWSAQKMIATYLLRWPIETF